MHTADLSQSPSEALALTTPPTRPPIPQRPNFASNADSIGLGAPVTAQSAQEAPTAVQALAGSNHDVVANRRAIRLANMSAAEVLKAELGALTPVKPAASSPQKTTTEAKSPVQSLSASGSSASLMSIDDDQMDIPGLGKNRNIDLTVPEVETNENSRQTEEDTSFPHTKDSSTDADTFLAGVKRKLEDDEEDEDTVSDEEAPSFALKVNADGSVEQEDTIKLVFF